jgi:hypothetical protein
MKRILSKDHQVVEKASGTKSINFVVGWSDPGATTYLVTDSIPPPVP